MKRKINFTLALTLIFATTFTTYGSTLSTLNIMEVDDLYSIYDDIQINDDVVMVNGETLADDLGIDISYSTNSTIFNDDENDITYQTVRNDDGLVPLYDVCDAFGVDVSMNEEGTYVLDTQREYVSDLEIRLPIDDDTVIYTYDEALEMAIDNNDTLDELQENIDDYEENLDDLEEDLYNPTKTGTTSEGTEYTEGTTLTSDSRLQINLEILQTELNMENQEDEEEVQILSSEALLMNSVTQLQNQIMTMESNKREIADLEEDLEEANLRFEMNMVSVNDITTIENSLASANDSLEKSEQQYVSLQRSLNDTLGLDINQDTLVIYEPEVTPIDIDEDELDKYINSTIASNVQIQSLEDDYDYYIYAKENTSDDDDEEDYSEKAGDAKDNIDNAKDAYELSIYSAFDNIEELELNQESLEADLQQAIDDYNDSVIQYDTGLISLSQVEDTKDKIYDVEQDLLQNALDYNIEKFQFENPNLL